MKTKFALILSFLAATALTSLAQPTEPAPGPGASTNVPPETPPSRENSPAPATNAPASTNAALPMITAPEVLAGPTALAVTNAPAGDELIDVNVVDIPLNSAILQLAVQAGLNIEFDPKLINQVAPDGHPIPLPNVQENWKNVTAMQALRALLENYGWQMEREPDNPIVRVVAKDPKALEPLVTTVVQLAYSEPRDIINEIRSTLSPRSWVTNDARTHQLILQTTAKELPAAQELISRLDTPTRQILIEARIVETSKDLTSAKGIDWTGTAGSQHVSFGNGTTTGTTTSSTAPANGNATSTGSAGSGLGGSTTSPGGRALGGAASSVVTGSSTFITTLAGTPSSGGGLSLNTAKGLDPATAFLNADGVSAVMSFLNTDADTKTIALPRTVSLDGVSNKLSVIQNFPIFEQDQSAPVAGAASGLQSAKPVYNETVDGNLLSQVGISLSVIPHIAGPSNVIISIKPEISSVDANTASATINGQVSVAGIYDRSTIETKASVPSGYTLVVGGLDKDVVNKTYTKIPLLGDLPGMGYIFGSNSKTHSRSTILIFVTPTIIQDSDYQPSDSHFLSTKPAKIVDGVDSAWDSAVPFDWTKPRTDAPVGY